MHDENSYKKYPQESNLRHPAQKGSENPPKCFLIVQTFCAGAVSYISGVDAVEREEG